MHLYIEHKSLIHCTPIYEIILLVPPFCLTADDNLCQCQYTYIFYLLIKHITTYGSDVWWACSSGVKSLDKIFLNFVSCCSLALGDRYNDVVFRVDVRVYGCLFNDTDLYIRYMYMRICMRGYVHGRMCIHIRIHMYDCTYVCIYLNRYYLKICIQICIYLYTDVLKYARLYEYVFIKTWF